MLNDEEQLEEFTHSVELTGEFLEQILLPILDKFETENPDKQYISGVATHGLFAELIFRMLEIGYTEKELRQEIKMCVGIASMLTTNQTLH